MDPACRRAWLRETTSALTSAMKSGIVQHSLEIALSEGKDAHYGTVGRFLLTWNSLSPPPAARWTTSRSVQGLEGSFLSIRAKCTTSKVAHHLILQFDRLEHVTMAVFSKGFLQSHAHDILRNTVTTTQAMILGPICCAVP